MIPFTASVSELKEMNVEDQVIIIVDADKSIVHLDSNDEQMVEVIGIAATTHEGKPAIRFIIEDL
ncbi:MAG: hypothetical protein AB7E61_06300 [Acholeplasmataceae bacterium]